MPGGGADLTAAFETSRDLLRQHRPADALAALDALLDQDPDHLGALVTRGSALLILGRTAEAEAALRRALGLAPHHPVILGNLGTLLIDAERHGEALALADATLAEQPAHGRALLVRGDALVGLSRFDEAVAAFEQVPLDGGLAYDALCKLGMAHAALQQHEAALAALDRAVGLKPTDPLARFRRGLVRLTTRDFGGWSDHESRWGSALFLARSGGVVTPQIAARLTLNPAPAELADQRILLLGEQGIGDQVMFASLIPDLQRIAASISCVVDARLVRLLSAAFPDVAFASGQDADIAVDAIDRIVAIGSLAAAFRPDESAFPGTPYLTVRPAVRARWAQRLGSRARPLRVGLSWQGGVSTTRRGKRSLDLHQLWPILDLPDCEFVSLQYGDVCADLAGRPIRAFDPAEIDDFEDLAALTAEMDVVVSVQTSLVHLCGAIGQSCLTLVPHNPEWRYTAHGSTIPWYRSVRVFRQPRADDWEPAIAEVADALRARLGALS